VGVLTELPAAEDAGWCSWMYVLPGSSSGAAGGCFVMTGEGALWFGSYAGGETAGKIGQPFAGAVDGDVARPSGLSSSCAVAALDIDI
jgi:hypothetical protein